MFVVSGGLPVVRRVILASVFGLFVSTLPVPAVSAQGPTPEQQTAHPQLVFEMTPARIEEAIAYAKREKNPDTIYVIQYGNFGAGWKFAAAATTPYLRVVAAATDAKRKYKDFTAADVTPEMIAPELHIYASSLQDGASTYDVETIVIMPKGERDPAKVVRPVRTSEIAEERKNLLGAEFKGKGMLSVFPLTMFASGHEVRIVRSGGGLGEIKAKIDVKRQYK
jgi:hypothetical protein